MACARASDRVSALAWAALGLMLIVVFSIWRGRGDGRRTLKVFALSLLGLAVIGAGSCALIIYQLKRI